MKRFAMSLIVLLFATSPLCFGQIATPSDINYDMVSNPDLLTKLLQDLFTYYQGTSVLFDPQTTAPTVAEGKLYYNDTANALYLYTGSEWVLMDTENGTSLDGAYDLGNGITVDGTAVTLTTGAAVNNSALALVGGETTNNNDTFTITHAGTGDAISINGASTGNLIYDEDGNFTVSSAGVMTFAGGSIATADFTFDDTYDILWDTSADTLIAQDNAKFGLGTDSDWLFSCDNTDGNLEAAAANDMFRFGETTNFDFTIHGGTNTNVVTFDTDDSALLMFLNGFDLRIMDDDYLIFGDSVSTESFTMKYDETTDNLQVVATAANDAVQFGDATTNTDVLFIGSGGTTTTNRIHYNASGDTNLGEWNFGVSDYGVDVYFYGATASQVVTWDQSADTWYFGDDAEGVDVIFRGDTTGQQVMWDESAMAWLFGDDADGVDVHFYGDTTLKQAWWDESGDEWFFGDTGYGIDVSFYAATAGDLILWDASDESLEFTGVSLLLDDDSDMFIGTGKDFSVTSDTANELDILPVTTDETSVVNFGATTAGVDLRVWGATGTDYLLWDSSDDYLHMVGDKVLFTLAEAAVNQFKVDATGTGVGAVIALDTTDGGISLDADGGDNGDITLNAADDMTLTAAGDLTLAVTGTLKGGGANIDNVQCTTEVVAGTTDALTAAQSGQTIVYTMTGGACTVTLPEATSATVGVYYRLIDGLATAGNDLSIDPEGDGTINGDTAGHKITNETDSDGCMCYIVCTAADTWVAVMNLAVWTEE